MIGPSITERDLFIKLRAFLIDILPANTLVIRAQVNRVVAPVGDFVLMTSMRRERLETNIDITFDTQLIGQVSGYTLTAYEVTNGQLAVGSVLFGAPGTPLEPMTRIVELGTGTGGPGTYLIDPVQNFYAAGRIYAGVTRTVMPTEVTLQLDVFGDASAENAQLVATLLRDEYATRFFAAGSVDPAIQPLHATDARQVPFIDAEDQYESRWIVEACLQANIEVDTPMQFADEVHITLIPPVDGWLVEADMADLLVNPELVPVLDPDGGTIHVPP